MTTAEAIRLHGAQAVYDAASRHMAGDKARGLACIGLTAATMGDVYAIQSAAYSELEETARAIDQAKAQADLTRISGGRK